MTPALFTSPGDMMKVCSSSNDDESFCEQAYDGDHQTFWRSNDITWVGTDGHHEESIYIEFEEPTCVYNIRFNMDFCHYILDKTDDYHFKDKLEDCRNYHGEEDTANLLCGYTKEYLNSSNNTIDDDGGDDNNRSKEINLTPITENYIILNEEIKAVKITFICHAEHDDIEFKVNAIVREVTFDVDLSGDKNASDYRCKPEDITPTALLSDELGLKLTKTGRMSVMQYVYIISFVSLTVIGLIAVHECTSHAPCFRICSSATDDYEYRPNNSSGKRRKKSKKRISFNLNNQDSGDLISV